LAKQYNYQVTIRHVQVKYIY